MRLKASLTLISASLLLTACGGGSAEPAAGGPVTLSFLVDKDKLTLDGAKALADAFMKTDSTVKVEVETRPGGTEGDNIVKTRLSTGDMSDVFWYNSGSLLQTLNPAQTMVDLTGDPVLANVHKDFLPVVSQGGKVYGVPAGAGMGGGILYNRKVYDTLGLKTPTTWAEFMANNEKVKAAGITPVITTFKDTWTSQLFVLGDFHNVQAQVPDFARDYTANKAKFAATPAALAGFEHLAEVHTKGYANKGFGSATAEEGLKMLVEGTGAHYPMLSAMLPPMLKDTPQVATDIGFFGVPGTDPARHGATVWEPPGIYIAKSTEKLEAAKKFLAFVASPAAAEAVGKVVQPAGPYRVEGAELPDDAIQVAKDLQAYIDKGATTPALEFLSPVKGPALEQITVAVGSGLTPPAEGAAQYDKDVAKQAKQLGLEGW
ncbi:raffinose/stachyose/melibiose transport system substrate-binding protein [Streptosporangium becharense]|uniref:Raffinose/stachyose/melibiose transport system substrate-binding protein n=1 Tax=Streptosporangium becharense TaxID=1816182 RepID=A0A7W9IBR6_9ACTN|nr:ABC transporter substrate-binding protein [Streptosporangium becharense]MBB2914227.1 raffinose/stachyose/melibiose transport system substrate-binding protein [Streptosporangium becharense]MBB5817254.1 raffinose/stachyose/melibiose transport system substrate-binding protein [Streptosporangium becharense]